MEFELTKYNIDRALKELANIKGKSIDINGIGLYGIISIDIEQSESYDSDPIPEENYDGGRREMIIIHFNYENGSAAKSYCPDEEICHFWHETDDLVCFDIEDIKKYVEKAKFDLDFRLQQYEEHMSK